MSQGLRLTRVKMDPLSKLLSWFSGTKGISEGGTSILRLNSMVR